MAKKTRFHERLVVLSSFAQILTSDHPTPFCFMVLSCSSLLGTVFGFSGSRRYCVPRILHFDFQNFPFLCFWKRTLFERFCGKPRKSTWVHRLGGRNTMELKS